MYSGIQIIIPIDNVIVNTYETALRLYNARYKTQFELKDWIHSNPTICFGQVVGERLMQMLNGFTLYDCTSFYPDILDSLEKLTSMGFNLTILLPEGNLSMYEHLIHMFDSLRWRERLNFASHIHTEQLVSAICIGTNSEQLSQTSCKMAVLYKQPWSTYDMPIMYSSPNALVNLIFQKLKING